MHQSTLAKVVWGKFVTFYKGPTSDVFKLICLIHIFITMYNIFTSTIYFAPMGLGWNSRIWWNILDLQKWADLQPTLKCYWSPWKSDSLCTCATIWHLHFISHKCSGSFQPHSVINKAFAGQPHHKFQQVINKVWLREMICNFADVRLFASLTCITITICDLRQNED